MAPYLTMAEGLKLAVLTFDKDVSKLSAVQAKGTFLQLPIQVNQLML